MLTGDVTVNLPLNFLQLQVTLGTNLAAKLPNPVDTG
jgi:hypothetical protein